MILFRNILLILAILFLIEALKLMMAQEYNASLVALAAVTMFGFWSIQFDIPKNSPLTEK